MAPLDELLPAQAGEAPTAQDHAARPGPTGAAACLCRTIVAERDRE